MKQANNFLSLQQVVQSLMNEKDEKSTTHYEKYLQLAIEVYSQMNLFEMNTINSARLELDTDTMTANLPSDFMDLIKVGIIVNGRLWTLTQDNNIIQPEPATICDVTTVQPNTITDTTVLDSGFWFMPYWWGGVYYPAMYGASGGYNNCYYRIDFSRNIIIFQGIVGQYPILLEYKSSGVTANGGIIPREALEAMKAGIHYYSIRNNFKYDKGERQEAERRYNIELYSLQRFNNSFTYEQIVDTLRSTYRQSPKR